MSRDYQHNITITARDNVTQVFRNMGASADQAAQKITNTGAAAGRSAEQYDRMADRATAAGAALGAIAAGLVAASAAAVENQRSIQGIEAAYGEAADEVLRFSELIQDQTNFSNDSARSALLIANTLTRNYGLSTEAVEQLVARSADLAEMKGITLADAVQRTSSAIRGEAESAEFLNLTLSDTFLAAEATKRGMDGWTTTMTEAEKAQFRFQILLEQTTYAQGLSTEAAQGARGAAIDLRDAMQDAAVGVGTFLGPVGQAVSVAGDLALALPLATAAIGRLAVAFGVTTTSALAFAAAFGPIGIAAAAIVTGLALATKSVMDYHAAVDAAALPTDTLTEAILRLDDATRNSEAGSTAVRISEEWAAISFNMKTAADTIADAQTQINQIPTVPGPGTPQSVIEQWEAQREQINLTIDANRAYAGTVEQRAAIEENLAVIVGHVGDNTAAVQERTRELFDEWRAGTLPAADLVTQIDELAQNVDIYGRELPEATAATADWTTGAYEAGLAADALAGKVIGAINAFREQEAAMARINALNAESRRALGLDQTSDPSGALIQTPAERDRNAEALAAASERDMEARRKAAADAIRDEIATQRELNQIREDAADERARIAEQEANVQEAITDAQRDGAREVAAIERDRIAATRQAEQGLAQELRTLENERVDNARETAQELRTIDQQRVDAAAEAEAQLADLAEQRQAVQVDLARAAREAELQWRETSAANLREQADAQADLNRSIEEARQRYADFAAENAAAQQAVREELRRTLAEQNRAFQRTQEDLGRDLAQAREDLKNAQDPEFYDAQAVADAKRRIEEIRIADKRATEDHKRDQRDARREARDEEEQLLDERRQAQVDYQRDVREMQEETAERLADLDAERLDALNEYKAAQRDANQEAAQQLNDIAQQEQAILDERKQRFAELAKDRQIILRDAAREEQVLAREAAQAQEDLGQAAGKAAATAARETQAAMRGAQTDIDALRAELVALTEEKFTVRVNVRERRKEAEDEEPLDRYLGGPVQQALYGRMTPTLVGEFGPELRVGNLIIPHGAAQSRDDYPAPTVVHQYVFPNARFELKTPDLGREVAAYVNQRRR